MSRRTGGACGSGLGLVAMVLTGCAILQPPAPIQPGVADPAAWQARQQRLADFDQWSLQGRAATGKLLGWTGNVSWRQRGDEFKVRVSGPLGAGGFRADGTLHQVNTDACCELRKTVPLERELAKFDAWITGRKRFQGGERNALEFFESEPPARLRINPLAHWRAGD
ncbi:MAG: phosphoadenosine phosphosulfate reductase family protein, partial [Salinisphaera sp.]|nr:phosphoadenosine phosphosulfate reductase family protein [Salinisphaera sp.]